jgi:probable F420-dependent oxidoreductase
MLALSAERTDGAHTYLIPPDHTEQARKQLGSGPLLCVEQAVLLDSDPDRARQIGRAHTAVYVRLPNYQNNLRRLGFIDEDFVEGGSDRLVDAIVAWGDEGAILDRVRAQFDAGADHVCVQPLPAKPRDVPADQWRTLAPPLRDLAASVPGRS